MVNGPEDEVPGWDAIDWRAHEGSVRRLRQRIFKAAQEPPSGLLELLAVKAARQF